MFSLVKFLKTHFGAADNTSSAEQSGKKEYRALIGDIGGTNIRLAIISFTSECQKYKTVKLEKYNTKLFKSLLESVQEFLKGIDKKDYPQLARIGVAGQVWENTVRIANLPDWPLVDGNEFQRELGIKSFRFYNDFEIAAYGVLKCSNEDLVQINDADDRNMKKPMSVLGAGTGLGVAFVGPTEVYNKDGSSKTIHTVFAGEGGHGTFVQTTEEHQEYYNFLKTKYPQKGDHVALEYGLVGPSIPYMYEFLQKKYPNLQQMSEVNIENELDKKLFSDFDSFPRKEVFEYGASKKDKLCQKVVDFFLDIYGIAIGDVCMKTLCYGGVYLCGSISVALCDYILENKSEFMKDYKEKRLYVKSIFDKIPIYIVKETDIGMVGAFALAQQDASNF